MTEAKVESSGVPVTTSKAERQSSATAVAPAPTIHAVSPAGQESAVVVVVGVVDVGEEPARYSASD